MSFQRSALIDEANARHVVHKRQSSSRPLSEDYELVGLAGEVQFELDFGVPRNAAILPGGDGRVDFTYNGHTFDPKVARKAFNLLREINKPHADILILGQYHDYGDEISVTWVGWDYDSEMLKCPVRPFMRGGPMNHFKPASELRSIEELKPFLPERNVA